MSEEMNSSAEAPSENSVAQQNVPRETSVEPSVEPVEPSENVPRETSSEDENVPRETSEDKAEPAAPEWFMKDKYKSIDEQAKSAYELQKKMGKYWGSPQDKYSIEGLNGIEENDPLVESLTPALKEMGVSQEGFKHLVSKYVEANMEMAKGIEENLKKTLTQEDAHTYTAIDKWMNENLEPGEREQIKNNWLMSVDDFKLFNHLRLMAAPSSSVPSSAQAVHFESSREVENDKIKYRKEVKSGARVKDANYENQLAARFRDAIARELRAQSR